MARTYHRDSNGRFASGGGSSARPAARGGTLAARSSLTRSRRKAEVNSSPAQRGAVTRAKNRARTEQKANRTTMRASLGGVVRRGKGTPAARPATGAPRSKVVAFRRQPSGNNIRPAKLPGRGMRALDRVADNISDGFKSLKRARNIYDSMQRREARDALRSNFDREVARQTGGIMRARAVVQRRQQRAFNVQNGRNPQVGSRALYVYQAQLRKLGEPSNQRVAFRRTPMTPSQMKRAKTARNKQEIARISRALEQDMREEAAKAAKPKPKSKRGGGGKRKRKG